MLLPGGPRLRNPGQRMCKRFVVCEQGELSTFKEEPEVSHGGVGSLELSVEGRVKGFAMQRTASCRRRQVEPRKKAEMFWRPWGCVGTQRGQRE